MSDPFANQAFPRGPLIGAAVLIAAVLLATLEVRLTGVGASHRVDAPTIAQRELRFEDRPDGSIVVIDATSGRPIDTVAPGTNGFLRGTLRGLARARRLDGIGAVQAFELSSHSDGRLTLLDPATNRRVDLESFGPTNEGVFARLLDLPASPQTTVSLAAPSGATHE